MKLLEKLKNYGLKIIFLFKKPISEDEYYENLFVNNKSWNSKEPNDDELNRWKIIEEFITIVRGDNTHYQMLDLGCGRGWLTNLLSKYGLVIGIEPVKKVVEFAKKMYPNITFLNGSTLELLENKLENKFDLIVSSEVIEHIPKENKPSFIKDIYKLLNDNGYCIITTPRKEIQKEWDTHTVISQPVEEWITENDLKLLFEKNNFKQILLKRIAVRQKKTNKLIDVYQVCLFKKVGLIN